MPSRLEMLQKMVEAKPDEPFVHYGLAMELKKLGRSQESKQAFSALISRHPSYVPSYLMYGGLLRDRGELEQAKQVLEQGMEIARKAGESHALSELQSAWAELA